VIFLVTVDYKKSSFWIRPVVNSHPSGICPLIRTTIIIKQTSSSNTSISRTKLVDSCAAHCVLSIFTYYVSFSIAILVSEKCLILLLPLPIHLHLMLS
jgi:hypothetical protein